MRKMLALVLLAVTSCMVIADKQCPEKYARFSPKHTFCLPPNGKCNIIRMGVDEEAKKEILRVHNELRSKVAMGKEKKAGGLPTASNMMEMEWDDELAAIAQKWASQCNFEHDEGKSRAVEGFSVGQNLAQQGVWGCRGNKECIEKAKKPDWEGRINSFYNEVQYFKRQLVKKYQHNSAFGHFTQVIWATSWRVGCGYVVYQEGKDHTHRFYACNYGPSGNTRDATVYKPGKPCTGCPANTCCGNCTSQDPTYTGLCQVVNKKLGPLEESKREGTIVDCNWKRGEPTCNFQVDGKKDWTLKPSLGGGSYYSIKLKGGEQSSLKLMTPIQPTKDSFCLRSVFRKSAADAANKDSSVAEADLNVGTWSTKLTLQTSSTAFTPYSIDLAWNSKTQAVLKISVPKNAPAHIFDLSEVVAYDGKCRK